jgi:hypothetical protein
MSVAELIEQIEAAQLLRERLILAGCAPKNAERAIELLLQAIATAAVETDEEREASLPS